MKKLIVSLLALVTVTISTQAQTRRNNSNPVQDTAKKENRKYHSKPGHKMIAGKLAFTDDQKQQMKSINTDLKSRMTALKNSNLSTEEYNTKKEALLKERKEKMTALLTPEQKDKLKQYKKEQHGKGKMDAAKRMEKMKEKLALSDDQVEKLNSQKEIYKSKEEAIRNNQALSIDDKKAQMKAIREERKNSFKSLLTPDQVKKMEELKQRRGGKAS